jgi:hypothetical protein
MFPMIMVIYYRMVQVDYVARNIAFRSKLYFVYNGVFMVRVFIHIL